MKVIIYQFIFIFIFVDFLSVVIVFMSTTLNFIHLLHEDQRINLEST